MASSSSSSPSSSSQDTEKSSGTPGTETLLGIHQMSVPEESKAQKLSKMQSWKEAQSQRVKQSLRREDYAPFPEKYVGWQEDFTKNKEGYQIVDGDLPLDSIKIEKPDDFSKFISYERKENGKPDVKMAEKKDKGGKTMRVYFMNLYRNPFSLPIEQRIKPVPVRFVLSCATTLGSIFPKRIPKGKDSAEETWVASASIPLGLVDSSYICKEENELWAATTEEVKGTGTEHPAYPNLCLLEQFLNLPHFQQIFLPCNKKLLSASLLSVGISKRNPKTGKINMCAPLIKLRIPFRWPKKSDIEGKADFDYEKISFFVEGKPATPEEMDYFRSNDFWRAQSDFTWALSGITPNAAALFPAKDVTVINVQQGYKDLKADTHKSKRPGSTEGLPSGLVDRAGGKRKTQA